MGRIVTVALAAAAESTSGPQSILAPSLGSGIGMKRKEKKRKEKRSEGRNGLYYVKKKRVIFEYYHSVF